MPRPGCTTTDAGILPATMELADPDIVDAEVFRMIVNATLIARYGLPVLDIRARRARV